MPMHGGPEKKGTVVPLYFAAETLNLKLLSVSQNDS